MPAYGVSTVKAHALAKHSAMQSEFGFRLSMNATITSEAASIMAVIHGRLCSHVPSGRSLVRTNISSFL